MAFEEKSEACGNYRTCSKHGLNGSYVSLDNVVIDPIDGDYCVECGDPVTNTTIYKKWYECTNCQSKFNIKESEKWKYCPKCGEGV